MLFHLFFQSDSAEVFILLAHRAGEGALISLVRTSVISQVIEKGIDILQACLVQKNFPSSKSNFVSNLAICLCVIEWNFWLVALNGCIILVKQKEFSTTFLSSL